MTRAPVDLSAHINQDQTRGHPANFPVTLTPIFRQDGASFEELPRRLAVTRQDTGRVLAIVSDRYTLVPHQQILDAVEEAVASLDVGPVPRGIFVDRDGARLRALYKFPSLARPILGADTICPCLKIQNTYDGTSRITIHIGAFRFVCTNLAVGGGGAFSGGFVSIHAGEIPIDKVAKQLTGYLGSFDAIVTLYRIWLETSLVPEMVEEITSELPVKAAEEIRRRVAVRGTQTVFDAYSLATELATHELRSPSAAFELLSRANRSFQIHVPVPEAAPRHETITPALSALSA